MDYKISDEILKNTTLCPNKFQCLKASTIDVCNINKAINEEVLFIDRKKGRYCPYIIPFGYSYICVCPTHRELYKLYKI